MDYDFSILELEEPIPLSGTSKARAACLPETTDTSFDSTDSFVVSGWGLSALVWGQPKYDITLESTSF